MMRVVFALIGLAGSFSAHAETKIDIAVVDQSIKDQIHPWSREVFNSGNFQYSPYISCRMFTKDRPGNVLLCLNLGAPDDMALVLGRTGIFIEGNYSNEIGTLLTPEKAKNLASASNLPVLGFDLKSSDLNHFLSTVKSECSKDKQKCLSADESAFFNAIQNNLKDPDFILITATFFPMLYGDGHLTIISHEISHALFFRLEEYRKIALDFWKYEVSEADRAQVMANFKGTYDTSSEYLVVNEFQAHTLQRHPEDGLIPEIAAKYRIRLMQRLGSLAPLEFQF